MAWSTLPFTSATAYVAACVMITWQEGQRQGGDEEQAAEVQLAEADINARLAR